MLPYRRYTYKHTNFYNSKNKTTLETSEKFNYQFIVTDWIDSFSAFQFPCKVEALLTEAVLGVSKFASGRCYTTELGRNSTVEGFRQMTNRR